MENQQRVFTIICLQALISVAPPVFTRTAGSVRAEDAVALFASASASGSGVWWSEQNHMLRPRPVRKREFLLVL